MVRTASGAESNAGVGRGVQGNRPGLKRQGSSGVSLETSGSLQSLVTPAQGDDVLILKLLWLSEQATNDSQAHLALQTCCTSFYTALLQSCCALACAGNLPRSCREIAVTLICSAY